jgi:hypothetical protein
MTTVIGQLSSVNLIAAAGILGNIGGVPISANANAVTSISSYENIGVVAQFANIRLSSSSLSNATAITLNNLTSSSFPALTDAVPSGYIGTLGNTPVTGFTSVLENEINTIMGFGDLGKFEQMFALCDSYVITTNLMVNSARNANSATSNSTYTTQDNTVTGGLSQISQAFSDFGDDLLALGYTVDLAQLPNLGSPQALLQQIYSRTGGSSELNTALLNAGLDQVLLNNLGTVSMTDEQQKIAFDVMSKITGSALLQILRLLKVNTRGLVTLADLLNPVKMFPKSFNTLTAPTVNGLRGIYINSSGTVNTKLETELPANVLAPLRGYSTVRNTYTQLRNIIPSDWALANKALQAGLQQVTSIFNSTLPSLGAAVKTLESNKGLGLINALTSPLPASVSNFFSTTYASGTGVDGTLLLADMVGTAGGWVVNDSMANVISILSTMTSAGNLSTLTNNSTGAFTIMQNTLNGNYTIVTPGVDPDPPSYQVVIPSGLPGTGTYASSSSLSEALSSAFTGPGSPGVGLIPATTALINSIVASNSSQVAIANSAWGNIAAQIVLEQTLRSQANIVYANLVPNTQVTLATNLSQYGLDTSDGGESWYLESVAATSTIGGQAIVSSLREARNQVRLQNASIQTDIIVSEEGVEPQISLAPGQYTAAEAASQKII